MMSSGPRSGFLLFDLRLGPRVEVRRRGLEQRLARGRARRTSRTAPCASSSLTALAKPKRNCSYVSGTARLRFAGLSSTGDADFSAEIGSGSTPRNGAGSIATDAAARPRPARICVSSPPNEWPIDGRLLVELADDLVEVVGDLADRLVREHLGVRVGLVDRLGIVGPARRERVRSPAPRTPSPSDPSCSAAATARARTRPAWRPDSFARSTCCGLVIGDRRDVARGRLLP